MGRAFERLELFITAIAVRRGKGSGNCSVRLRSWPLDLPRPALPLKVRAIVGPKSGAGMPAYWRVRNAVGRSIGDAGPYRFDHPDRVEGAAERVLFARQGNLGVTERDPVDRLPVEVGGIGVAGLFRDFTRAREGRLGPAVDVVFDRLVGQRSWCRHLRARLVERLAFEPFLIGPVEEAAGFLEASDDGGDGREPVAVVVFVDDGRHGSPHSCVAGRGS